MEYLLFLVAVLGVLAVSGLALRLFGARGAVSRPDRRRVRDPWSDKLFAVKRTVDDESYRARARESMRTLVDERFRTGAAGTPRSAAGRARAGAAESRPSPRTARRSRGGVQRVRTPWGW